MTSTATIRDLKRVLYPHFDGAVTVLRRLREEGLLPQGLPGRSGIGSAVIGPREATLVLLGLAAMAWSSAIDVPAAALRLADFRLRPSDGDAVVLLDVLAGELHAIAGGVANFEAAAWRIGEWHAIREGDPRLRFIAPQTPLAVLLVQRQTILEAELIVAVAAIFRPAAAERAPGAAAELERA